MSIAPHGVELQALASAKLRGYTDIEVDSVRHDAQQAETWNVFLHANIHGKMKHLQADVKEISETKWQTMRVVQTSG